MSDETIHLTADVVAVASDVDGLEPVLAARSGTPCTFLIQEDWVVGMALCVGLGAAARG